MKRRVLAWMLTGVLAASAVHAADLNKLRHTTTSSTLASINITQGPVTGLKRISARSLETPWFTIYDEVAKRDYKIYVRTDTRIWQGKKLLKRKDLFKQLKIGDRLYVRHSNNRDGWQIAYYVKYLPGPKAPAPPKPAPAADPKAAAPAPKTATQTPAAKT